MRYERPRIEGYVSITAGLLSSVSGGGGDFASQPVWRTPKRRYEAPAIEDRLVVKALAGRPISDGGGDLQPVWRPIEPGEDPRTD